MITETPTTLNPSLRQLPLAGLCSIPTLLAMIAMITSITAVCSSSLHAQSTQPASGSVITQSSADADDADVSEDDAQAIAEHARDMQRTVSEQNTDPQNNPQRQGGPMFDQKQSVVATPAVPAQPSQPAQPLQRAPTTPASAAQNRNDRKTNASKQAAAAAAEPAEEHTLEELKPEAANTEKSEGEQVGGQSNVTGKAVVPNLVPSRQPWEYYKPLVERNIFTRTQPRSSSGRDKTQTTERPATTTPAAPKASWVLTGIVIHAQGNYAFFENTLTNVTLRVTAGESLGESRLTSIGSDHVIAASGDAQQNITIGSTIDGSTATLGAARSGSVFGESTPPVEGSTTPASSASSLPLDDAAKMSIIERMRAKRLQESNK